MAIDIVDFPIKNDDFPWQNVSSPEAKPPFFITGDVPGACTAPSSAGPTTNGAAPRRYARRCAKVGRTRGCQVGGVEGLDLGESHGFRVRCSIFGGF